VAKGGLPGIKGNSYVGGGYFSKTSSSDFKKPKLTLVGIPVEVRKPPSRLWAKA
jgi:hypothetical protein